jgi:hypothetical protein
MKLAIFGIISLAIAYPGAAKGGKKAADKGETPLADADGEPSENAGNGKGKGGSVAALLDLFKQNGGISGIKYQITDKINDFKNEEGTVDFFGLIKNVGKEVSETKVAGCAECGKIQGLIGKATEMLGSGGIGDKLGLSGSGGGVAGGLLSKFKGLLGNNASGGGISKIVGETATNRGGNTKTSTANGANVANSAGYSNSKSNPGNNPVATKPTENTV